MRKKIVYWLVAIAVAAAFQPVSLARERSSAQTRAFQRMNPCPSTGERRGRCPGYVIDHVQPLCAGGEDHPRNMQWQTVADAKVKDRVERRECRAFRKR